MRRAARIDANMPALVEALRAVGCSVLSLAPVGQGVPDLLVGVAGKNLLIEVKDPAQPASKRQLTADQKSFHANWRGAVHLVETIDQALAIAAYARGRLVRP